MPELPAWLKNLGNFDDESKLGEGQKKLRKRLSEVKTEEQASALEKFLAQFDPKED